MKHFERFDLKLPYGMCNRNTRAASNAESTNPKMDVQKYNSMYKSMNQPMSVDLPCESSCKFFGKENVRICASLFGLRTNLSLDL